MRRARPEPEEVGQDSFLDVVANVVGVLIMLVMLVGLRAAHSVMKSNPQPTQPPSAELPIVVPTNDALKTELSAVVDANHKLEQEVLSVRSKLFAVGRETAAQRQQQLDLATYRAVIEDDVKTRREHLDAAKQQEFDVQRSLFECQLELEQLSKERLTLYDQPDEVVELTGEPTPVAKTVDQAAIHLRVSKGMVSIVPLDELIAEIEGRLDDVRRRLRSQEEVVETAGPIDGYRVRFTARKVYPQEMVTGPRAGIIARVEHDIQFSFLPTASDLGMKVEQALLPSSALSRRLKSFERERPAVVIWLYSDSFDSFAPLKAELAEMGFPIAVRPLLPGQLIEASPNGTPAEAQ